MTTATRTQRTNAAVVTENDMQNTSEDFRNVIHKVGTGMRDIARTSSEVLTELQDALKPILPLFSEEEQNQMYDAFIGYHKLLISSQKFLTRALILAARARTSNELMASINIQMIHEMCSNVESLTEKFLRLNPILQEKLKDQQTLKRWRNILGLFTIIGVCSMGIACGIARFTSVGFSTSIKAFLTTTGAITVAAGAPAITAHVAQHEAELNHIKNSLKNIRNVLTKLSQNYPQIEEMAQILSDEDDTRRDFLRLLQETQIEVNKGSSKKKHFNKTAPALYTINTLKFTTAIFFVRDDWLADPTDMNYIFDNIPNETLVSRKFLPGYNHADFMIAITVNGLIYVDVLDQPLLF
ncbi:hypothetical protein I4U23_015768 [Adineta vaga]|nr:hypothetical protein I4U23_015768 [Adineta vaga]